MRTRQDDGRREGMVKGGVECTVTDPAGWSEQKEARTGTIGCDGGRRPGRVLSACRGQGLSVKGEDVG